MSKPEEQVHASECHRGIFRIDGPLPGYLWTPTMAYEHVQGRI